MREKGRTDAAGFDWRSNILFRHKQGPHSRFMRAVRGPVVLA
jgi:hypothetical protein